MPTRTKRIAAAAPWRPRISKRRRRAQYGYVEGITVLRSHTGNKAEVAWEIQARGEHAAHLEKSADLIQPIFTPATGPRVDDHVDPLTAGPLFPRDLREAD